MKRFKRCPLTLTLSRKVERELVRGEKGFERSPSPLPSPAGWRGLMKMKRI
jgi:hypothetical protein